jgi:hypothetical protein
MTSRVNTKNTQVARSVRAAQEQSMRGEAKSQADEYEKSLDELWTIIRQSDPQNRKVIIDQLGEKTINALRTRSNPYKKPIIMADNNKVLAFGIINMTEKYAERFAMTSLIGFIYRMLDEYKPPGFEDYISENDAKFAIPFNAKIRELQRSRPEQLISEELAELSAHIEELKTAVADPETGAESKSRLAEAAKRSYFVRTKLLKHRIYWAREDLNILRESQERASKQVREAEDKITHLTKSVAELKEKLERKRKFEAERLEKQTALKESQQNGDDDATIHRKIVEVTTVNLPEGLSAEDVRKRTGDYLIEIQNKDKLIHKESERLTEFRKEEAIRIAQREDAEARLETFNTQFRNLKVEYLKKTGQSKAAAELILEANKKPETTKRPSKAKKGKKVVHKGVQTELDEVQVDKYEPSDVDFDTIAEEVKKELGITKTAEEYTIEAQNGIELFLDEYFRYNPDNHVRCAYRPNYEDPQRTPLEKTKEEDEAQKNYERTVIPPDDTFFRWKRYAENNYECLRQATDDIYCEKADFESAIVPLAVFEGKDKDEVDEEFNKYKRKYADEFDGEIFGASFGRWNLLASWEQNREVRDFYTERTEIIKRIIDKHKSDQRMGTALMKDRVNKKKKENEAKEGPSDPGLGQYRRGMAVNAALERHGGRHVDDIEVEDIPRDTDESTTDEVEVGVHVIRPYMGGGRRRIPRGIGEQWKFHIPSEPLPEGSISVQTGPQFQEKNADLINEMTI